METGELWIIYERGPFHENWTWASHFRYLWKQGEEIHSRLTEFRRLLLLHESLQNTVFDKHLSLVDLTVCQTKKGQPFKNYLLRSLKRQWFLILMRLKLFKSGVQKGTFRFELPYKIVDHIMKKMRMQLMFINLYFAMKDINIDAVRSSLWCTLRRSWH